MQNIFIPFIIHAKMKKGPVWVEETKKKKKGKNPKSKITINGR